MDCWTQIQGLRGRTLRTLDRHRPFEVLSVDENEALVRLNTGKVRAIKRSEIERAHDELVRMKELDLGAITARHSARSGAYVAAILAECQGIQRRVRPVRLLYSSPPPSRRKRRRAAAPAPALSERARAILGLVAEGHTYEQILSLHPEFTYHDIFAAAREALGIDGQASG